MRDADGSGSMTGGGIGHALCRGGIALLIAGAVPACKPPPQERQVVDAAAAQRGKAVIERVQCASCHEINGVRWPKGRLGPSLLRFDDVGLIAGALPNRPELLADFVRDAPAVKTGSTMPPMPISDREARDVAAYLYASGND